MVFLISLVAATLIVLLFRKPLQKTPLVFYGVALVLVMFYLYAYFFGVPIVVWRYFLVALQRCTLALAFFSIVMFIGVLPEKSRLWGVLAPIRRQLSILGCIFACGHMIVYIDAYLDRFLSGFVVLGLNMAVSLSIALLLALLLVVLLVTSFTQVHKRMKPDNWKRLQRLSYPFYLLIFVHIILIMMPSVLAGSPETIFNVTVYSTLFLLYSVLRLVKFTISRASLQTHAPEVGGGHVER